MKSWCSVRYTSSSCNLFGATLWSSVFGYPCFGCGIVSCILYWRRIFFVAVGLECAPWKFCNELRRCQPLSACPQVGRESSGTVVYTDGCRSWKTVAREQRKKKLVVKSVVHSKSEWTRKVKFRGKNKAAGTQQIDRCWFHLKKFCPKQMKSRSGPTLNGRFWDRIYQWVFRRNSRMWQLQQKLFSSPMHQRLICWLRISIRIHEPSFKNTRLQKAVLPKIGRNVLQYCLEGWGGRQFKCFELSSQATNKKICKAIPFEDKEDEVIDAGFDYILKHGPCSSSEMAQLRWQTKAICEESSPICGWPSKKRLWEILHLMVPWHRRNSLAQSLSPWSSMPLGCWNV